MHKLLVYILFCVEVSGFAWAAETSYLPYYRAINCAELAIVEFRFARALSIYDSIFVQFPKRHSRDLYNAALCALLCQQPQKAQQWIMDRIAQGASIKSFKASTFMQQPPEFWHAIEQHYDSLRAIVLATRNQWGGFKAVLDTMDSREQRALVDERLGEAGYHALLYAHAQQLYRLIDSAGVPPIAMFGPGQQLPVGVMRHHFGLRNGLSTGMLDTSVAPYRAMDMHRYDVEPLLLKAVHNGDIVPDLAYMYTTHNDSSTTMGSRHLYQVNIDLNTKTIAIEPNKRANIGKENIRRSLYGLPTVEDALRKDVHLVLYYNQDCYPFDEHIQSDLAINFTNSAYDRLAQKEKEQLLLKRMEAYDRVKSEYMNSLGKRIPHSESQRLLYYNMLILKDFILPSGGYVVSETMLK